MTSFDMKPFYRELRKNPIAHAHLLNTFSYLEYIGFRKIVKSQEESELSLEVLSHASEEARHALMLKKMAIRLGVTSVETYHEKEMLCGSDARAYFQKLDHYVSDQLQPIFNADVAARLTYLYVTWLIEVRALAVYADYTKVLSETGHSSPLGTLMAEEDRHLEFVTEFLTRYDEQFLPRSVDLKKYEAALFGEFFQKLEHGLSTFTLSEPLSGPLPGAVSPSSRQVQF